MAKQESPLVELSSGKLIRLSKSCLRDGEKQSVLRVLDKEFLGMGEEVQAFERELTGFFGRQAVCVVNGTAALHLALQASGVGRGDEVLVPSLTYVACFQAISATGAVPVACDVDPQSLCLDWRDAEKRITAKTKAIMPVHYSGGVGDLDSIYALAQKAELRVIEDAAHAFGSSYQKRKVGSFGDIACFSFDGIKNITSGEGGCIVTDDQEVLNLVRDARLLGVEKDSDKRYSGQRSWEFDVNRQGWRYHMSNVMAAIGIEQLKRIKKILSIRKYNFLKIKNELIQNKKYNQQFSILEDQKHTNIAWFGIPFILNSKDKNYKLSVMEKLNNKGVMTRPIISGNFAKQPSIKLYKIKTGSKLHNADLIDKNAFFLGLHNIKITTKKLKFLTESIYSSL